MKSLQKKTILSLLVLSLSVLLCACGVVSSGSYSSVGSVDNMSDRKINHVYSSFNGDRTYTADIKAGSTLKMEITTKSGSLAVTVTQDSGELFRTEEAGSFSVPIEKDGKVSIALKAVSHEGSYLFTW